MTNLKEITQELEKYFKDHPDKNKIVGATIGIITKVSPPQTGDVEEMDKGEPCDCTGACMQKPNGCKVAQQRTEEEVKAVLKWITEKDSPVAIMYGGTPELEEDFRFAD